MLEKSLTQRVVYEGLELHDLTSFIETRGLNLHPSSTNIIMARSSSQNASHPQLECREKTTLGDDHQQSNQRKPKNTIATQGSSIEARSINTSTRTHTVLNRFKAILNSSKTVFRLDGRPACRGGS
ncbi:hypothetical protein QM012_000503 [Aureobasidium pullulans]|uniref:Uncharacterized protein n=1 Tax=Aureobasidium pullulans TaxID=5580 RepID=A0ABR0TXF9_AURPU